MLYWEPEGRYRHRLFTAIAPFWFSTEHHWILITPFWLSTDELYSHYFRNGRVFFSPFWGDFFFVWREDYYSSSSNLEIKLRIMIHRRVQLLHLPLAVAEASFSLSSEVTDEGGCYNPVFTKKYKKFVLDIQVEARRLLLMANFSWVIANTGRMTPSGWFHGERIRDVIRKQLLKVRVLQIQRLTIKEYIGNVSWISFTVQFPILYPPTLRQLL